MPNNPTSLSDVVSRVIANLGARNVTDQLGAWTEQLRQFTAVNQSTADVIRSTTQAVTRAGTGGDTPSGVATGLRIASSLLEVSPVFAGLARLFSGQGDRQEEAPLTRFALPPRVDVIAGQDSRRPGDSFLVDFGQGNTPRPVASSQNITIQVQALDSRSILDRSQEIAQAVRLAMIETGALTDVIREA